MLYPCYTHTESSEWHPLLFVCGCSMWDCMTPSIIIFSPCSIPKRLALLPFTTCSHASCSMYGTQAAAARVVGYEQTSVKGRAVTQEPVPGVGDSALPGLLEHALVYKELENRGALEGEGVWMAFFFFSSG